MRTHMPGPHARFLADVSQIANLRTYILSHSHLQESQLYSGLQKAYNACVDSLVSYRNKHVQVVSRYLLRPAQQQQRAGHEMAEKEGRRKEEGRGKVKEEKKKEILGTGGTAPIEFLKQVRNETREKLV